MGRMRLEDLEALTSCSDVNPAPLKMSSIEKIVVLLSYIVQVVGSRWQRMGNIAKLMGIILQEILIYPLQNLL